MTGKRLLKKSAKVIGYVIVILVIIVIGLFAFINTNYGKQTVKNRIVSYLVSKFKTKVSIASIDYSLPKWVELKGVYIEDQQKDTLLYGEEMAFDLNMIGLLKGVTYIRKVEFKNMYANLYRKGNDTLFNFEFVVNAFAGKKVPGVVVDTTALDLTLDQLLLNRVRINFKDDYAGNSFIATVNNLDATLNKFQPDRLEFGIDKIKADTIDFLMTTVKGKNIDTTTGAQNGNYLGLTSKELDVRNLNVWIDDKVTGMHYDNKVQHLSLNDGSINLASQKIFADKVLIDSSTVQLVLPQPDTSKVADSSVKLFWNIGLNELQMKNNRFKFDDNSIKPTEGVDPAHLDLSELFVKTKRIRYTNDTSSADIQSLSFKDKSSFSLDSSHVDLLYTKNGISATNLYLKTPNSIIQNALEIKYDVDQLKTAPENSSVSVKLNNSVIAVNDLYLLMPSLKKTLKESKFRNNYVKLNTEMNGNFKRVDIPFLQLVSSSGSNVNAKATLYNVNDPNKLSYDIYLYNSTLQRSDIVKFLPDDKIKEAGKLPPVINVTSHLTGNMKTTNTTLDITGSNFRFAGQGSVQNFDNPAALKYDVNIKEGRMTKDFITTFLPANTLPETISLPEQILISGTAKGDMNNVESNMKLGGSYGVATVKGNINNFKNVENAKYNVQIATEGFELGKFLKNDSIIGRMSLTGTARGTGMNYKTMNAEINTNINAIEFKKYTYQNVDIHAVLNNGTIKTEGTINDPSIKLQYDIAANVKNEYPSAVNASLLIDTLLLGRLNLVKDTMSITGKVNVDAPDLDPKNLQLFAVMDTINVNINNKNYFFDSIVTRANTTADSGNVITFRSPLADISAKGHFEYDKVGQSLIQYIDAHYNITNEAPKTLTPQQITFEGNLKKHPIITDLTKGLQYDSIYIKGSYASDYGDSALNLTATMPYIEYNSNIINNGRLAVSSKNNSINSEINFEKMQLGSNTLYATTISAGASDDSLNISGITKDEKDKDRFAIGAIIAEKNNAYSFSLKDTLLLDYQKWNVAPNNRFTYSPEGILVKDFVLSNNDQKISLISRGNNLNSPIDGSIENFNIQSITSILNNDTLLASGLINGKFTLSQFSKTLPSFTGDLELSKFSLMQQPIGTVKIFAERKAENVVHARIDLSENGNVANIDGDYYLNNEQQQFDANINITSLSMATIQAFSQGNLVRSSGSINGDLALNGKLSDPRWKGFIGFDSTKFAIAKTGTSYTIDKQKIIFDYPAISFANFTIKDSAAHSLVIDGNIRSKTFTEYDLALDVNANDFILINTPQTINDQLYGYAAVDMDIALKGNSVRPEIEGNLSLNDESDVTLVLPEQNINKDAARSIVRFIDRDTFALPEKVAFSPANEKRFNFAEFLNYNLNIEVSKKAQLTVIIDPSTGDALKVQGDAQLNAGVDPGGHLILVGNYELSSGSYVFNYQFIQRQFNLLPGSTITFAGDPMDAQINITAEYVVNTSAKDLLGNEVGEVDPRVSTTFNQKIPFHVLLYLKGDMKKPEITFDIQMPDENTAINGQLRTTIENKLSQLRGDATATNKQVFSLLLLNRFAGEQSTDFFRGSGESAGDVARESVSQLLSSALDQIVGDIFKGVDVDLNINSYKDYSSGDALQRTDLSVAVTKSFLDDRLSISVGKNFGIEGDEATAKAQQKTNTYLPDVTLNYKLTKDGKYMLRAYRKDEYEVILDGYVVETGIAFILTLDYDKFKELFWKK